MFSKKGIQNEEELEQILDEMEGTQVIEDLENIQWVSQYKIERSAEYVINKLQCKLPANAAERIVLDYVVREKK